MRTLLRLCVPALAAAALMNASPAAAQQTVTYVYTCNIGGAPAQLVTQVTPVGDGVGGVNYQYVGRLDSQSAHYTFSGENSYADFTTVGSYERFRVQFIVQGNLMTLVVNPQGPGPTSYQCQRTQ